MILLKNLSPDKVADELRTFVEEHEQHELRYVIAYAIGYYGVIDDNVWAGIRQLLHEGVVV